MATYEYRCRACGESFTQREKISEHDPSTAVCPRCQSRDVERLMSGFYARTPRKS